MTNQPHFAVFNHQIVKDDGQRINRKFIVLRTSDGLVQFTDFHKYIKTSSVLKREASDGNSRFDFVAKLLTYAYFTVGIQSFNDISVDVIADFLNKYGLCELPDDTAETTRSKNTVERCFRAVMDFLESYLAENGDNCSLKEKDLYHMVNKRDKHGKVIKVKMPVFDIRYKGSSHPPIFRDIPNKCFNIMFAYIATFHKEIFGLVLCGAFGGLRPSEACNVRRADSPLGAGIRFFKSGTTIYKVDIDLKKERKLRDDNVIVGNIKKERIQTIPDVFLDAFVSAYDTYMTYLNTRDPDAYGAFTLNKQGRAMTYASYLNTFHSIVANELVPIFLEHSDPEVVMYGRILMEHRLSPHVFRHWYTVQLVLSGVSNPGILQKLRGDSNPESSLRYLADKSELAKKYAKVSSETFDYMKWLAKEND